MSGFFSLDGKNQPETDHTLYPSRNEEIYSKGFQLWQQDYQFQQQQKLHSAHHAEPSSRNVGADEPSNHSNFESERLGFAMMMGQFGRSGNDDGLNCQDCGNQAKKDCVHMRCRTCCKSRGYPCPTHVKSTWVPAAKRRERQQQDQRQLTVGGENPRRPSGGGGGGFDQLGHFPAELNSPAVFRCVRVSAMDDGDEQLAYQTAVNIGGHVFKGILYDQGPESQYAGGSGGGGEGPSGSQQQPQPQLDLIAGSGAAASTNPMLDPPMYSPQMSGFMAGTQFFLPPRP